MAVPNPLKRSVNVELVAPTSELVGFAREHILTYLGEDNLAANTLDPTKYQVLDQVSGAYVDNYSLILELLLNPDGTLPVPPEGGGGGVDPFVFNEAGCYWPSYGTGVWIIGSTSGGSRVTAIEACIHTEQVWLSLTSVSWEAQSQQLSGVLSEYLTGGGNVDIRVTLDDQSQQTFETQRTWYSSN